MHFLDEVEIMEDPIEIEIAIEEPKQVEGLHAWGESYRTLREFTKVTYPTFGQARESVSHANSVYAMLRPIRGTLLILHHHQMLWI